MGMVAQYMLKLADTSPFSRKNSDLWKPQPGHSRLNRFLYRQGSMNFSSHSNKVKYACISIGSGEQYPLLRRLTGKDTLSFLVHPIDRDTADSGLGLFLDRGFGLAGAIPMG